MPTSRFIQRFQDKITGVLSGFDRIVIRGTLRRIVFVEGMKALLWHKQILLKQFGGWAEKLTEQLKLELVPRLRKCLFLYHYYLIQKVPRTHRYLITPRGRDILSAVLAAHRIRLDQLNKLAA